MVSNKKNIIFCGTPDFAVPCLELLHSHPLIEVIGVVSMPDRKANRGQKLKTPPVAEFAKQNKIALLQTENINKETEQIEKWEAQKIDGFIVLAFAQFLGKRVLQIPQDGCFNIHTSLLPLYRGAAPIQYALLHGDKYTGISIQKMVKEMDAGDLAFQHKTPIFDYEQFASLWTRMKYLCPQALMDFLDLYLRKKIVYHKQDPKKVSFAPSIKKEEGRLFFNKLSCLEVNNKIRAFATMPGTFCFLNEKRLKIFEVESSKLDLAPNNGSVVNGHLNVGCLDGTLRLKSIQLEGKKKMQDIELLRGMTSTLNFS